MIIIYGLGNNEPKFLNTKHNIGRDIVTKLADNQGLEFKRVKNLMIAKSQDSNNNITYAYSCDYMNTSGKFLGEYISFIKPEELKLIIIHDDSDQFEGCRKLSIGGSSGGHNGIKDIQNNEKKINITKDQLIRLKIGIRPEFNKGKSHDFVLNKYSKIDEILIADTVNLVTVNLNYILENKIDYLQNKFNTKL